MSVHMSTASLHHVDRIELRAIEANGREWLRLVLVADDGRRTEFDVFGADGMAPNVVDCRRQDEIRLAEMEARGQA